MLLHRVPAGSVAGVDQSQEMVRQAAARNADALRSRRADLRYGSVERLPFADETFDKALAINSMQAWPDARAGLREIRRVLKHAWQRRASAPLSTRPAKRALRSCSPLLTLRNRESWTSRSSSARSRQGRDVDMPKEVTIRALTAWLRRNGFNELRGKKTGHRYFEKDHVKITLPGHGPGDLTKKHVGMILRQLQHMGYDRDAVRDELQ
jgi:ubiquinone/menaquinone biosynthesis C-methylase UbiE